jgi:hypothetical protein
MSRTPAVDIRRRVLLIAAAVLLAGCDGMISHGTRDAPVPRYFQLELPPGGNSAPVPGQVSDTTATVVGAEIGQNGVLGGVLADTFVAPVPGRPEAVMVGWVGGACDARTDVDLSLGAGGTPTFTVKVLARPGACELVGVLRRVTLTFDHAVNATDFRIEVVR